MNLLMHLHFIDGIIAAGELDDNLPERRRHELQRLGDGWEDELHLFRAWLLSYVWMYFILELSNNI